MSPDLIAFLKAWYEWATNGAPEGEPFYRDDGLCDCLFDYTTCQVDRSARRRVRDELRALFPDSPYPFGGDNYWERFNKGTQHECPKRLAWVRERLIEAGEIVS